MNVRLFVYGSLRKGYRHHDRMEGAVFECTVRTAVGFRLILFGAYPALVEGGEGSVEGEVYLVSAALIEELDVFEGCPDLYQRARVLLEDGTQAETYRMGREKTVGSAEISDGRWCG
jgi:gamma-glutamylcyclotransferase (GGCT)/AIG2-like uncharacterized protein YtfP